MPANPWNYSSILLSNNAGARIGSGIANLGAGLAEGIKTAVAEHRQKKKEKELADASDAWLEKNGAQLSPELNLTDPGERKALIKAAGGGPQAFQLIQTFEQMKMQKAAAAQQQQLGAAQLAAFNAGQQSLLRNAGAARLAAGANPNTAETGALIQGGASFADLTPGAASSPDAVVADYLRRSGDIKGAGDLGEGLARVATLNRRAAPPQVLTVAGRPAVQDASGNLQFVPEPKADPRAPVDIGGGKKAVVAGGTPFDYDTGQPIQTTAARRPSPPPFELKTTDPELYAAMREDYLSWSPGGSSPAGGGASAKLSEADQEALAWAKANPKDSRAAAIRKKLGL